MSLEIKPVNAEPVRKTIFVTIYGDPGNRKTSWAASAESPVILDFDKRAHRAYTEGKVDRIDVDNFDDISEVIQKFRGKYKTLIIDTAGRALDIKTSEIIRTSKKTPTLKAHNQFGGLSLPGYGILKTSFYNVVQEIADSGMHCIFVCHGKRTKEGDSIFWEPDVVGSSADEIYKISDLMGLMAPVNGRTAFRCNPSEQWQGKNPLGLSTVIIDKKDEPGWDITMRDLIDQCVKKVSQTAVPVELPPIIQKIEACNNPETANDLLGEIQEMQEGIDKDLATSAFKSMRTKAGFKYSKEKGVYK
jgi:hypothetical protein